MSKRSALMLLRSKALCCCPEPASSQTATISASALGAPICQRFWTILNTTFKTLCGQISTHHIDSAMLPGTPHHQALLERVVSHYQTDSRIIAVCLFGSLVRGNWDQYSDLD